MTTGELRAALGSVADPAWLAAAQAGVAAEANSIVEVFPAVGRRCGRGPLPGLPGWRTDDAARVLLLRTLPAGAPDLAVLVTRLYRDGDANEKRAVLLALSTLDLPAEVQRPLLQDAIRTNDTRLIAAAVGPAAACLPAPAWRQAVIKCVFTGVELHNVADLETRADAELAAMLAGLVHERRAAGRTVAPDALALLDRLTAAKPATAEPTAATPTAAKPTLAKEE
ncbi:MAG: EboA domain-containing protein [Micromonosporaceae bacterium]|nr:EboA domain-containing protein [Micromonosporaceae bacterium]